MLTARTITLLWLACALAPAADNVVKNGDFEQNTGSPLSPNEWNVPNREWMQSQYIDVYSVLEGENHYLTLKLPWSNKLSGLYASIMIDQTLPLDPSWQGLKVSCRIRTRELNLQADGRGQFGACLSLAWQNAEGEAMDQWPVWPKITGDQAEWVDLEHVIQIPQEARSLLIRPGLWETSGEMDIDDIVITPIRDTTAAN